MAKSNGGKKELGIELEALIDAAFAKFEVYLPSPQDVAVYRRKRKEYLDEITAALREGGMSGMKGGASDGRDDGNLDDGNGVI